MAINDESELAFRYHDGTKHPGGALMDRFHAFDPARLPLLYKSYLNVETVPLSLSATSKCALDTSIPTHTAAVPIATS